MLTVDLAVTKQHPGCRSLAMHPSHILKLPATVAAAVLLIASGSAFAQYVGAPQPRPGMTPGFAPGTQITSPDGRTTTVNTATGFFPSSDPDVNPTNLLPTYYGNIKDAAGHEIPNTLSSTAANPYNLHPDPVVSNIDATSPLDDLTAILRSFHKNADRYGDNEDEEDDVRVNAAAAQRAIDILEGNPVAGRVYSGMPVLHYNGPNKWKQVTPIRDSNGNTIGGNVVIRQIWYQSHIESDTSLLDISLVKDVPWTITYQVDTLNRGKDDFAPSTMYFDDPKIFGKAVPSVMLDGTFFPMNEGTRTVYQQKMGPGRFYNLTYTWGWRVHPGRVQVSENAGKVVAGKNLLQWEQDAFGPAPTSSDSAKAYAISRISNLAPEKRMWSAFKAMLAGGSSMKLLVAEAEAALDDWEHRSRLPRGVTADPNSDITLFLCNNTIYASVAGYENPNAHIEFDRWKLRGAHVRVKLINGDYYTRGYMNVDFGGLRGWENTFQNTIPVGGDGPWFTFGRLHWWPNVTPVVLAPAVPAAAVPAPPPPPVTVKHMDDDKDFHDEHLDSDGKNVRSDVLASLPNGNGDTLTEHWIDLTLNFEHSRRLRLYQFDPLHHDVAVFSIH
jgi:hypothetical protein